MANPEHLEILKQGVGVWNKWMDKNMEEGPIVKPDFRKADFCEVNLDRVNFRRADLRGANLFKTHFIGANLSKADLRGANLREANLSQADLCETHLSEFYPDEYDSGGGNVRRVTLFEGVFCDANLYGTNFDNAFCFSTIFTSVDLSEAKNLDTVNHNGPSNICIDTLYKSKGNIPEAFLRGCGVPDQTIEYSRSLTASPIEYYSCFISYSSKDEEFAKRVHNDLQAAGVRCWFAPHDIQGGKKIHHQIDEAIRIYDKLLLILSPNSMNSNWVGSEIIRAQKKEDRQSSQMLFPVSIVPYDKIKGWEFFDSDSGRDLAREIREYHIPDFSLWKKDHDAYSNSFDRLLQDLKSG